MIKRKYLNSVKSEAKSGKKVFLQTCPNECIPSLQKETSQEKKKNVRKKPKQVTKYRKTSRKYTNHSQQDEVLLGSRLNDGPDSIFSVMNTVSQRKQEILEESQRNMKAGESSMTISPSPRFLMLQQELDGNIAHKRMSILMKEDFQRKVFSHRKSSFSNDKNLRTEAMSLEHEDLAGKRTLPLNTELIKSITKKLASRQQIKPQNIRRVFAGQPSFIKSSIEDQRKPTRKLNPQGIDTIIPNFSKSIQIVDLDKLPKIR